jgi:hypothetical protein
MKHVLLSFFLCFPAMANESVPAGKWRFADITCSNPDYKFEKDEQSFIDALHDLSAYDEFVVDEQGKGTFTTYFNDRIGSSWASCAGADPLELEYPESGKLRMKRGPTTWESKTSSPDVEIQCGSKEGEGDSEISEVPYEISPRGELLFSWERKDCGIYSWHWVKL